MTVLLLGLQMSACERKKVVLVPLVMPVHPCAKQWSSLLIALSHRSLSRGSLIIFLLWVMVSLVTGCTTPLQYSSISMTGILIVGKFSRDGDGRGISKSKVNDMI